MMSLSAEIQISEIVFKSRSNKEVYDLFAMKATFTSLQQKMLTTSSSAI